MSNPYCTTREAAHLLGISHRTAQQWLDKGYLKGWKTSGGHRRITRDSIELMQSRQFREGLPLEKADSISVLIIEDDVSLLKLYHKHISRWPLDVTVHTAPNGYEGLVMVGEVSPDLLICDLRLPGVNGFQIVRSLSEIERLKSMVIVVVSGLPSEEIDAHGGLPANVEIIGKPIDFIRVRDIGTRHFNSVGTTNSLKRVRQY